MIPAGALAYIVISLFVGILLFLGGVVLLVVWSRYVASSSPAPLPSCTPRGCEGCDTCITRDACLESGQYVETLCDCSCNPESFLSGTYAQLCSATYDIFPMCDCSTCITSFETKCEWVPEDLGCDCSKCDYSAQNFYPDSQKCDPNLCCKNVETVLASCSGDQQSGGPCDCAVCAQAGSVYVCPDGTVDMSDCYGCSMSNFSGDKDTNLGLANCLVRGCPDNLVTLDEACDELKISTLNDETPTCYASGGDDSTPNYQNYGWCSRVTAGDIEYRRYGSCQDDEALTCTDCSGLDDAKCTSYEGCAWKDGSGEGVGVCESTICASGVACFRSNDPKVNTLMNNNSSAIPSCCLPIPAPTSDPSSPP